MPRVIPFPPAEDARDAQPAVKVPRSTETGEAPADQGARSGNMRNIRATSNAERWDASPVECSATFTAGCKAWAAFAAEDAAARPPAALEARVLRAAQQALAERRRAEVDRRRRVWHAAAAAVAAGVLAASAWSLAPASTTARNEADATAAPAAPVASAVVPVHQTRGGRVPMTNVEAGRMLGTVPHGALPTRPLFELAEQGPVRAPLAPRGTSFGATPIGHATSGVQMAESAPAAPQYQALPTTAQPAVPATADPAHAALSSKGFRGMFDPAAGKPDPAEAGYRLELANPAPAPAPAPEPPPED